MYCSAFFFFPHSFLFTFLTHTPFLFTFLTSRPHTNYCLLLHSHELSHNNLSHHHLNLLSHNFLPHNHLYFHFVFTFSTGLLPDNRYLTTLRHRPLSHVIAKQVVVFWYFEDFVKRKFAEFVAVLQSKCLFYYCYCCCCLFLDVVILLCFCFFLDLFSLFLVAVVLFVLRSWFSLSCLLLFVSFLSFGSLACFEVLFISFVFASFCIIHSFVVIM